MICKIVTRFACAAAFLVSPWFTGDSHSQVLTMREALTRALAASPRLTAAERDVGVATGQRIQAGALLNPEVSYEQDNSFGSGRFQGTKSAETTLQISQAFEWFGKREARIAGGEAGVETAAIQRQAVRLEVPSETAIAFANVLGAKRRIQILDEQVAAIDRLTPLLQRRVEAGASSPAETGRAEVASALVKADRERLRSTLASARRELAVLMGDPAPKFASVSGRFEVTGRPPSFQSVVAAIDANPQLARWIAVYAQRKAAKGPNQRSAPSCCGAWHSAGRSTRRSRRWCRAPESGFPLISSSALRPATIPRPRLSVEDACTARAAGNPAGRKGACQARPRNG